MSTTDCGPAALKCLLQGWGISVGYGRLREACQTDVDGTSIDALEQVAETCGLLVEKTLMPVDHVLAPETQLRGAITVLRRPDANTHFVVLWRGHGRRAQVMDPGVGRRWPAARHFLSELYVHSLELPAAEFRAYTESSGFALALTGRLQRLGFGASARRHVQAALARPGWRSIAALDAAARMVEHLIGSGALARGTQSAKAVERFWSEALLEPLVDGPSPVPAYHWSAIPAGCDERGDATVHLRGAVMLLVRGLRPKAVSMAGSAGGQRDAAASALLSSTDASRRPWPVLARFAMVNWKVILVPTACALILASVGVTFEALIFRALIHAGRYAGLQEQRLAVMALVIAFSCALIVLEWPLASGLSRMGRHLEARLRMLFLDRLALLDDSYFQSRLRSDMAERAHSIHALRTLPSLIGRMFQLLCQMLFNSLGIMCLDPQTRPWVLATCLASLGLPLAMHWLVAERDLRVKTHLGALSRFYLDALLGLVPVRAHAAEHAVRCSHENLLVGWARAALQLQNLALLVEGAVSSVGFACAVGLVLVHVHHAGATGTVLLLGYWALSLPGLGSAFALAARQLPSLGNLVGRFLEPIHSAEATHQPSPGLVLLPLTPSPTITRSTARGMSLEFRGVSVRAGGQMVLDRVHLQIAEGSHVAMVGPSGAGKSSLLGALLGWHRVAEGELLIDGAALDRNNLEALRRDTAWLDPSIQLWNQSLLDNLCYGASDVPPDTLAWTLQQAGLRSVVESLPNGLQTVLGEGGALLAGGEGQRVRFARALLRRQARLVVFDEPFRGLDHETRRTLLAAARRSWQGATFVCVTHDVCDTLEFDQIVVLDGGRVVETGAPAELVAQDGRYRRLLDAETRLRSSLWGARSWRRLRLTNGLVTEEQP